MKRTEFLLLLVVISLSVYSCGKDSPFTDDYWDTNGSVVQTTQSATASTDFIATLQPFLETSTIKGTGEVSISAEAVTVTFNLTNVPFNFSFGKYAVTSLSCLDVAAAGPPAPAPVASTRSLTHKESGSPVVLLANLNQGVIDGNNLVFYGLSGAGSAPSQVNLLFPLACGPMIRQGADKIAP